MGTPRRAVQPSSSTTPLPAKTETMVAAHAELSASAVAEVEEGSNKSTISVREVYAERLAAAAVDEITEQLKAPGNDGYVYIETWNTRYKKVLGPMRAFLESRSEFVFSHTQGWTLGLDQPQQKPQLQQWQKVTQASAHRKPRNSSAAQHVQQRCEYNKASSTKWAPKKAVTA